jgi:putative sugar O-methyltransferase
MVWKFALWAKNVSDRNLERLRVPWVGNPVVVFFEQEGLPNVGVTLDSFRFDSYAHRIACALPDGGTVLEIGGGYGGVALQLLRTRPGFRVVLCDLPDTLYLAGWWLSNVAEARVAWWDDDPDADIVLLPCQELDAWAGPVDLVFTAHSLSGMDRASIAHYVAWVERSPARYFYHDDVLVPTSTIWMNERFPEVPVSEMPVPRGFRLVWRDRTPWTGLPDRFCEFFYEREG